MSERLETRDRQLTKDRVRFGINKHNACYCQIIVLYMGTIAMPEDTRAWVHRKQSVHNAIKRLTDCRSTQTLVRLNLSVDGIRLCSSSGKVLMHHSRNGVASFGLCAADDMLFCLVTLDGVGSSGGNVGAGPSCQIFRVDPRLTSHRDHLETAESFGVRCEISVDRDYCVEFPTSAPSAIELFKRFYAETLTVSMFKFCWDSLDVAMFVPPGFESQFSISGKSYDSDIDRSEMNSSKAHVAEVRGGGSNNVRSTSDQSKKFVLYLPTIKPLREDENVPGGLERTAFFPADVSLQDLGELDDTLKCDQLSNDEMNCESTGSLDVGMVDDQYNSDLEPTDSPNGAENMRSQVKKFLRQRSEPSPNRLHIQRFNATETSNLGPESPLPSLPVRLKKPGARVDHEVAHEQAMSQKTPMPSHTQRTCARSQSVVINQVPATRTLLAKKLVTTSKLSSNGKVTLHGNRPYAKIESRDGLFYFSPIVNTHSMSANVDENQTFNEGLVLKEKLMRLENLENFVFPSSPWNLSFHGSLESFSDNSDTSEETKFFGSCRELAPNCPGKVGRAASWAVAFENLLNDNDGVAIFLQHLKNEFSQENINFWLKCKEFKELPEEERKIEALKIYETYLDPFGYECVNVDQTIVIAVKKSLQLASVDLFDEAQKHIFKLMKEDSYSRFRTSQLYKDAVVAEMEGRPFPSMQYCPAVNKDSVRKIANSKSIKLKDDKRRMSLGFLQKKKKARFSSAHELLKNNQMTKVIDNEKSESSVVGIRVTLPNGSVRNIEGRWGQKISHVLLQLSDELEYGLNFIEAIDPSTQLVLDVTKDVKMLSCKDIHLKNCVLFRLTLPNEKSLAVRGRSDETVNDTLGPSLKKHGLTLDKVVMHIAGTGVILKDEMVVDSLNCCHVVVESLIDFKGKKKGGTIGCKSGIARQTTFSSQPIDRLNHVSHFEVQMRLEELFRDVFDDKVDFSSVHFDDLGIFNLEKLGKLNGRRSSSRFNLFTPRAATDKARPKTDFSKKPQAYQIKAPDDKFFNLLMSAQGRQLDSQRGMLKKEDLQMPDFLKEDCNTAPSFPSLDVTPTPSGRLSLSVENTRENHCLHNIRVSNSLTSMEERSRSSSESTSTDHEWNIENDSTFGAVDHDILYRLSRTARQSHNIASNNVERNVDISCNGIAGAKATPMQRAVRSNFSSKVASANGAFEPRTAASAIKTDDSSVKSFRSSYV